MSVLEVRREGFVAHVTLNRPEVRNAFNAELIAALSAAFEDLSKHDDLRVIVLGANGKAFCAGADLNWMRSMADYNWAQNHADAQKLADMLWTLYQCPVPVVGKIQGDCYAGGTGLAAICDVLIASDNATFCLSEARLGLSPATISPYVVRALGEQASRRYMVTAERFSAAQAHALGFVHDLCGADELEARVAQMVATLVANGPKATRACKKLARDVSGEPISKQLRDETARRIADIRVSEEGKEGLASFLHKRPAGWV